MNNLLYITGIICVLAVSIIFTATALSEPVAVAQTNQDSFKQTYTVKEFITVSDGDSVSTESETNFETGTNPSKSENATETIFTPSAIKQYYNIPLAEELQDVIFSECEKYSISPSIVIAMIERESQFDRYAIGDDGRSFGLMQIQAKSHIDRMIALDCTDIFDPIKNIKVGIHYLAEMQNRYGDITKALVAYNSGSYDGTITNYATAVMSRANTIEKMRCENG
ncbi:MAG: lytic transglycosylase domain-containing protein [Ruminococcaceae bacterium]|nr:lytic transglycosylase domain-containing protein [Oscillospiraceae bacterium]